MNSNRIIRQSLTLVALVMSSLVVKAQLWSEDFSAEANGATSGTAGGTLGGTWSTAYSGTGTFSRQNNFFVGPVLYAEGTDSEGVWSSNTINISSVGYAIINADVYSAFVESNDYLRISYVLDGVETVFYELIGGNGFAGLSAEAPASAIVAGDNLQVKVYTRNDDGGFFTDTYAVDNVSVTAAPIIYSRKSGTWDDVTGGAGGTGTWSLTGPTGTACGCYPLNTQVAVINSGHTVTIPASKTTIGTPPTTNLAPGAVDVYGTLQFNTNNVTLGIQQGLFRVRNGGIVNSSGAGITGEQIAFLADVGGATFQTDAGGSASIEDLVLATGATNFHYLTGGGALTVTDDILINASNATLTNNRSASFTVGDQLNFNSDNSAFTNNGTVTISGDLIATDNGDDNNVITNANGATISVGGINPNSAIMDILNSGTINQSGNFTNIITTDDFDNLSTGVWNWSLTPNTTYDTDVATALNLTAIGNTFNYNGAGAQRIIPTTYHHIELSTSGAKDANSASFSVQGDWTVSGTATFTEGTGTVTFNGSVAQTITNSSGETFYNLTINNSFGASPQLTTNGNVTVSNVLTMTDGNVNLNGNTFALTSSAAGSLAHGLTSASGWMYGGSFTRARAASANFNALTARSLFPLGSASDWRPFFVGQSSNANTAGTMTVTHTNATSTSDVSFADGAATITRRHDSYWTVSTTGISAGATFRLQAGGTNFGTIANSNHLRMSTSTGVVGTHVAGSGGPTDWRVSRNVAFSAFANNFHLASTNAANSPLPIELLSFTAELKNSVVELKWSTASETDNDYFTIERAIDLEHFEAIIEEDGAGTTKELRKYKVIDASPLYGRSYYRLKQTDFDGKFSYSPLQVIDYEGPKYVTLTAFPNPLRESDLTIRIEGLKEATVVPVQILNMQGQKVYENLIDVTTPGIITAEIPASYFMNSGLYIIKAGETLYMTKKIVIE